MTPPSVRERLLQRPKSTGRLSRRGRWALASGLLLALGLQLVAVFGQSFAGDEVTHLVAGHQALRYGQNRQNLEHPPLVKLIAAFPLLFDEPLLEPEAVEPGPGVIERAYRRPERLIRAGRAGRLMTLIFIVLPTLGAGWTLTRWFYGSRAAAVWTLLFSLSFSILPNLTILQTDTALTLATLTTAWCCARYLDRPVGSRALAIGACLGLALSAKFSGALLAPAVAFAVLIAKDTPRQPRLRRILVHLLMVGGVATILVAATYEAANLRYSQDVGRETLRRYCQNRSTMLVGNRLRPLESQLLEIEKLSPQLAQWATGFLSVRAQNAEKIYLSYAFGDVRSAGRWWYFPALTLVKTPLILLLVTLGCLFSASGHFPGNPRTPWPGRFRSGARRHVQRILAGLPRRASGCNETRKKAGLVVGIALATYLLTAMTSNYNIGFRHLMSPFALVLVPLSARVAARRWRTVLVVGLLALEAVTLAPLWMSATNTWWLGAHNPTRWSLSAGNLEWGQNFVQLRHSMQKLGIEPLRVLYPRLQSGVVEAWIPGAIQAEPKRPLAPGWYAITVLAEQLAPALVAAPPGAVTGDGASLRREASRWVQTLDDLHERGEDHGYVAGTFHLYRIGGDR